MLKCVLSVISVVDLAHRAVQSPSCGAMHDHDDATCTEGQVDACLLIFRRSNSILFVRVVVRYSGKLGCGTWDITKKI